MTAFPFYAELSEARKQIIKLGGVPDLAKLDHPLLPALAMAVPFEIEKLMAHGGPLEHEVEPAIAGGLEAMEKGDILLFGGKKGEAARYFAQLARVIAVLAFQPGGITVFGQSYVAEIKTEPAL